MIISHNMSTTTRRRKQQKQEKDHHHQQQRRRRLADVGTRLIVVVVVAAVIIMIGDASVVVAAVAVNDKNTDNGTDQGPNNELGNDQHDWDRPNLVILFADNLAYHDVSCFRDDDLDPNLDPGTGRSSGPRTPNIDKLASEGMKFRHWNSAAALCSASRAALLTSKYPVRTGVYPRVFKPDAVHGLSNGEKTIASYLKDVGYATKIVGKWHLGHRPQHLPTQLGFEEWTGIPYHMSGGSVDDHVCAYDTSERMWLPLYRQDQIIQQPVELQSIKDLYSHEAVEFIQRYSTTTATANTTKQQQQKQVNRSRKPFFLYMSFSHVHQLCAPRDHPEQQTCQWAANDTQPHGHPSFTDAVQEMDDIVGNILQALDEYGVSQNTMVIFTSDNGPWVAEQSCAGKKGPFVGRWLQDNIPENCTACPHDYKPSPTPERPRRCVLSPARTTSSTSSSSSSSSSSDGNDDDVVWDLDGVHCGEDTGLGSVWEANLRMPAIVRYNPGGGEGRGALAAKRVQPGSTSNDLVSTLDVLPTFLSIIGQPIPNDIDGIDISTVLFGSGDNTTDQRMNDESTSQRQLQHRDQRRHVNINNNSNKNSTRMLFFWRDGFEEGPLPRPYGRFDVAATKRGHIKAWFWTKSAHYNDDREQYHDPPLLFDVDADPAEAYPLDPFEYRTVVEEIKASTRRHKETIRWGPPLALATDPTYIPCVDHQTGCRTKPTVNCASDKVRVEEE